MTYEKKIDTISDRIDVSENTAKKYYSKYAEKLK